MKASDILLEAPEEIHLFGDYDDANWNDAGELTPPTKYCAIGLLRCKGGYYKENRNALAALAAVGMTQFVLSVDRNCPACRKRFNTFGIITHLNDEHTWTFKQIGSWLKELGY